MLVLGCSTPVVRLRADHSAEEERIALEGSTVAEVEVVGSRSGSLQAAAAGSPAAVEAPRIEVGGEVVAPQAELALGCLEMAVGGVIVVLRGIRAMRGDLSRVE